ncbi:hypothetical protein [Allokutzneria oryzae]|uniref:DUF3558 domain-containing protein n=1 Tax=Allokutzneria oryzae TaxID=1378989 RepID=A0ABV5ZUZ4_9PSEU
MNKRPITAVVLALALLSTGCTSTVPGEALSKVDKDVVPIPEEPAEWAVARVDACKLLSAAVPTTLTPSTPEQGSPHSCAMDVITPDYGRRTVRLNVGAAFDHADRMDSAPFTARDVLAYQELDTTAPGVSLPGGDYSCEVNLPLSATTSIQVTSATSAREPELGCATPREVIDGVVERLAQPEPVLRSPGNGLGDWPTCALLASAPGGDAAQLRADQHRVDSCYAKLAPDKTISIEVSPAGDPVARTRDASETVVRLGGVDGLQNSGASGSCTLAWAQEPVAKPYGNAFQVITLRASSCEELPQVANNVRSKLAGPPPVAPQRPSRLGFPADAWDEVTDPACQITRDPYPDSCRKPRAVAAPRGIDANMASALSEDGKDAMCAALADAMRVVTAAEPILVVVDKIEHKGCVGRTPDFTLTVTLAVTPDRSAEFAPGFYCYGTSKQETVTVADRPAKQCSHYGNNVGNAPTTSVTGKDYYIAVRGSLESMGMVTITSNVSYPRGVSNLKPAEDAEKLNLVDRIATHLVTHYFPL